MKLKEWTRQWILTTEGMQKANLRFAHEAEQRGDIGERDRLLRNAEYIDKTVLAPIVWLPLIAFFVLLVSVCAK